MSYFAHSGKMKDKRDWQPLNEHLRSVAGMASAMAINFGLERAAYVAGLFHDLGKYSPAFQKRLEGSDVSVDHSTAGAALLGSLTEGNDKIIAGILGYAIAGHHAGLPDKLSSARTSLTRRLENFANELDPIWRTELTPDCNGLAPAKGRFLTPFAYSVMGRMIFSCVVDADFKDTESYYCALEGRVIDRAWKELGELLPEFRSRVDIHVAALSSGITPLNTTRSEILTHIRGKASMKPGLFTLTVPTGGGKTLASLAFALDHAHAYGKSRIIYTIPFTSIVDQTASIFRDILGVSHVLEHHSAVDEEKIDPKTHPESRDKIKLAMEDWAAPVIVTTNVQFFESLFAAKPSRARKLHNIANSVIILDEAQTIPRPLLVPCARMLDELSQNYGCSIVLCTATQPALDKRRFKVGHPAGLALEGRELAPDPVGLASKLKRSVIQHAGVMNNDALIAALDSMPQGLVIVNSRRHALELFRQAKQDGIIGLVHLTTRQYAVHRREILEDIRLRLKADQPCRLIATSLIEAGVDVDFPRVWRAEAGLDQIVQAAGRCNREGLRPLEESVTTVFSAPDYPPPPEIKGLIGDFQRVRSKHDDVASLAGIEAYFAEVYWRLGEGLDGKNIMKRFSVTANDTDFAYRTAAEDFQMIESGMVPVIVVRDEAAAKSIGKLAVEQISSGAIARELQGYVVQVPPKARDLLIHNGHVEFTETKLRGDQFAVLGSGSLYDPETGLLWENADYLANEGLVF